MTALIRIGDEASVRALLPYLRSQDAGQRAAPSRPCRACRMRSRHSCDQLLEDSDSDVRLLATELARNMPAENATRVLCGLLEREQHPNVCAAAIERAGRGRDTRRRSGAAVVRRTICWDSVSGLCGVDRHRPDFRRGRLRARWRAPSHRGTRAIHVTQEEIAATLRISLSSHRNDVCRQQTVLHRSPPGRAHCRHRIAVISGLFRDAALRFPTMRSNIWSMPSR